MDARLRDECLVYGYARKMEKTYQLFMNIDNGIYGMIHDCYPKSLRFGYYIKKRFNITNNDLTV